MYQFLEKKYQSKVIKISIKGNKKNSKTKNKIRIAILGGSTTDLIKNTLEEYLAINSIEGIFFQSDYNQFFFEGINPLPIGPIELTRSPTFLLLNASNPLPTILKRISTHPCFAFALIIDRGLRIRISWSHWI